MGARRESEEARYLQELGMSIHEARQKKPKQTPPRGTMPISMLDAAAYDRDIEPLKRELIAIKRERQAMRVEPIHSRCLRLLRAGNTLQRHPKALAHFTRWKKMQVRRRLLLDRLADRAAAAPTVGYLHLREEPATHPLVDLALRLLATRQTNATSCAAREHMPEAEQRATLKHFKAVFKVGIENAWLLPLLDEIERAALERQSATTRRLNLTTEQLETYSKADPPKNENQHAARALMDTRKAMQGWPVQFDLPPWLDAYIVAFILARFGFARGGGGNGKTSRATFLKLLTNPRRIAKKIAAEPPLARRLRRQLRAMRPPKIRRKG